MKTPQIITALSGASSSRRSRQGRGFLALITAFATTLFANFTLAALPAYVQGHYNFSLLPRARMTVLYTNVQAAGDLNIVIVAQRDTVARVKSVRDSMGNKYTPVPPIFSGNFVQSIFYAWNVLPAGAGANTVTVDFDIRATSPDVRILEYSGIVTTANPIVTVADLVGTTSIFAYQFGTSDWSSGRQFYTLYGSGFSGVDKYGRAWNYYHRTHQWFYPALAYARRRQRRGSCHHRAEQYSQL